MGDFVPDNGQLSMRRCKKIVLSLKNRLKELLNIDLNYASKQSAELRLMTAMAHNFYQYLISRPLMKRFGVKKTSRVKKFIFCSIAVPAKWIKTARQYILNYSTDKPYDILFALE